jgi:hypothetical protein
VSDAVIVVSYRRTDAHDRQALWPSRAPLGAVQTTGGLCEGVETLRRRLTEHGVPKGGSILHLGPGGGSIDYHLARGYRVVGEDRSPEMIA